MSLILSPISQCGSKRPDQNS